MLGFLLPLWTTVALQSTLRVQVVDDAGKPCAHVPLSIRSALVGVTLEPAFAATGEDGIAEFVDVDRFWTADAQKQIPIVVFEFPMLEEDGLPLLMREVPTTPLRLELPAHSSVAVSMRTQDGKSCPEPATAKLMWVDPASGDHRFCEGLADSQAIDILRFPYVGLGVEAHIEVRTTAGEFTSRVNIPPPKRARDEISLVAQLDGFLATVLGRALSTDGEVLSDRDLVWWRASSKSTNGSDFPEHQFRRVRTDAKGFFHIVTLTHQPSSLNLALRGVENGEWPRATIQIYADPAGHSLDLGDVELTTRRTPRLVSPPILLDGVVSDAMDDPIAGVRVCIVRRVQVESKNGQPPRIEWRGDERFVTETKLDGSFVLRQDARGKFSPGWMVDSADVYDERRRPVMYAVFEQTSYVPELVEVVLRETRTLHVRLLHPCSLGGSVRLAPGIDPSTLRIELVPDEHLDNRDRVRIEWMRDHDSHGEGVGPGPAVVDASGGVRWTNIPPGQFDLRIAQGERVLYTLPKVRVSGDSLLTRLPDMDLREIVK